MTRSASPEASTSYSHTSAAHRSTVLYPSGNGRAQWPSQPISLRDAQPAPDASLGRTTSPDVHRSDEDRLLTELHSRNPLHPTLPPPTTRPNPAPSIASVIPPFHNHTPHHSSQHGRPPHLLSASPLPSSTRNGYNHHALESHRPSTSSHHETINSHTPRPRTSAQVFHNISELAAHHGIPIALPPLPRTTPRSQPIQEFAQSVDPPSSSETPTSPEFNFADLCSSYLTMLSQKKEEHNPAPVESTSMQAATVSHEDAAAVQALMDVLQASPEFTMAQEFGDFLTSPTQYLTSPLESPLDDFLPTPAMGTELDFSPDILTSPMMMDFDATGYGDISLFGDVPLFDAMSAASSFKAPAPPKVVESSGELDGLITMTPSTPSLDPSSLNTSPLITDTSFPAPLSATAPSRRKNAPNGTRKNITPSSLIPVDAPIQPRKYVTPSSTSRKEVPATFARKRARSEAFGEEEIPELPLDATEEEQIKNKRLQNTLAARRSRKRKLEYQKQLEDELDGEREQKEKWRAHAMVLQSLLRSHGIEAPTLD